MKLNAPFLLSVFLLAAEAREDSRANHGALRRVLEGGDMAADASMDQMYSSKSKSGKKTKQPSTSPSTAPSTRPSTPPSTSPSESPTVCPTKAEFLLDSDEYAVEEENYYWLKNTIDGTNIWDRPSLDVGKSYEESSCIESSSCAVMYIEDNYGDGAGAMRFQYAGNSVSYKSKASVANSFGQAFMAAVGDGCGKQVTLGLALTADRYVGSEFSNYRLRNVSTKKYIWEIDELISHMGYQISVELNIDECYQVEWNDLFGDGIGSLKLTLNDLVTFEGLTNGKTGFITVGYGC
jgi:hypothetical protein